MTVLRFIARKFPVAATAPEVDPSDFGEERKACTTCGLSQKVGAFGRPLVGGVNPNFSTVRHKCPRRVCRCNDRFGTSFVTRDIAQQPRQQSNVAQHRLLYVGKNNAGRGELKPVCMADSFTSAPRSSGEGDREIRTSDTIVPFSENHESLIFDNHSVA